MFEMILAVAIPLSLAIALFRLLAPCRRCGSRLCIRWSTLASRARLFQPDEREHSMTLCLRCNAVTERRGEK